MPLSCGRTAGLALSLISLAAGPTVAVANVASGDDGPRNPAAEAATGDTDAMLAVIQHLGSLYLVIPEIDLHARRFDRVLGIMQCG